jgi:two-component system phosphate regulon sensor histidine kinase PhoR
MKSDFVAAVTHELKTPVALIRLVGDTLANGRYNSPKTVQEYAGLLSVEASRLGNSIDNLLTYARYSGARAADSTELVDVEPADLIEDALQGFRPTLATLEFELIVELPPTSRRCASTVRPSSRRSRTSSTTRSSTRARRAGWQCRDGQRAGA